MHHAWLSGADGVCFLSIEFSNLTTNLLKDLFVWMTKWFYGKNINRSIDSTEQSPTQQQSLNPVAAGEEICNLFGFQVGMKHCVAGERNSCVYCFCRSHVRTCLFHSGVPTHTAGPRGVFRTHRKNGFGTASRTHACLSSNVRQGTVTFRKTAHMHARTHSGIFRVFSHICEAWESRPKGYPFKGARNLSVGCEGRFKVFD